VVLLVPPLILSPGDALDKRLDGRIGSRIGVGVDAVGGLFRPERRQGRDVTHYRRLADGPASQLNLAFALHRVMFSLLC